MKRWILWLAVGGLIAVGLALTSCGTAEEPAPAAEEKEVKEPVKEEPKVVGPRYGGTLRWNTSNKMNSMNIADQWDGANENLMSIVYEGMFTGDWDRGPSGTGELPYSHCCMISDDAAMPALATEIILEDPRTFVFKIREGVKFHNKPPLNGREFTAEDAAFAMNKMKEIRWPRHNYLENVFARDKYTLVVEVNRGLAFYPYEIMYGPYFHLFPEEVYEAGMGDWRNAAGTGPFMVSDLVMDSHITFERNPDYWRNWTAPDGTKYQLPFVDKIIHPLIDDPSTKIAAIITGQIDAGSDVAAKFKRQLEEGASDLTVLGIFPGSGQQIFLRMDKPELPTYDIRVRLALNMAIDRKATADSVYGGEQLFYHLHPTDPLNFPNVSTPLEDAPQIIQDMYTYDPDKAKELLAEAGFPDGFKTDLLWSQSEDNDALMEMVMYYWKQIGVQVTPNPMENATAFGKFTDRDYQIILWGSMTQPNMRDAYADNNWNGSMFRDDYYEALWEKAREELDRTIREPMVKELAVIFNSAVPHVAFAAPNLLVYWYPWVMNYHGERNMAYQDRMFLAYIYLDEDLRTEKIGEVD